MEDQTQIQEFYQQSARQYARYWLGRLQEQPKDNALLDAEIENVFSALTLADQHTLPSLLIQGVEVIYHYCEGRGLYTQIQRQLLRAYQAAESLQDKNALARNVLYRGRIALRSERFDEARDLWNQGLPLAHQSGETKLICDFYTELGVLAIESRQYTDAQQFLQQALALAEERDDSERIAVLLGELCRVAFFRSQLDKAEEYSIRGLAITTAQGLHHRTTGLLVYLGIIAETRGHLQEAQHHWERGLVLARQVGNLARLSNLLVNLGMLAIQTEDLDKAEGYLREGLDVARRLGQRQETSHLLMDLGLLHAQRGRRQEANECMDESIRLAQETGHPPLIAYNLLKRGEFHLAQQEWQQAAECFEECASVSRVDNEREREKAASALWGMAQVEQGRGNPVKASHFAAESLTIFDALGHRQAEVVRRWLLALVVTDDDCIQRAAANFP